MSKLSEQGLDFIRSRVTPISTTHAVQVGGEHFCLCLFCFDMLKEQLPTENQSKEELLVALDDYMDKNQYHEHEIVVVRALIERHCTDG